MKCTMVVVTCLLAMALCGCGRAPRPAKVVLNEEYKELTYEELKSYPGDVLACAVSEHVMWKIGNAYDREREIVLSLPRALRAVHTTFEVECEVMNGGFNQYFWNSSGKLAAEALEDYRLIGATKHAAIMAKAIEIHTREEAKMAKFQKEGTVEAFSESYQETELNKLDMEFYELKEDVRALRVKYVREHPEACAQ